MPKYVLRCPHCGEEATYTFSIGTGAGLLQCPKCTRLLRVETERDQLKRVLPG